MNMRNICPDIQRVDSNWQVLHIPIYNPHIKEQDLINLIFDTPKLVIEYWNILMQSFQRVHLSEAFCYDNPDHKDIKECEVYIKHKIPALSTLILRVTKNNNADIEMSSSETVG